jgi:hypothetical protein
VDSIALLVNEILGDVVLRRIHAVHDGARGTHRHFMLAASAAVYDGYFEFHRLERFKHAKRQFQ